MDRGKPHYRELLEQELAERCQRNHRYSLRAFARDLEVKPSQLSDVLHGKQGLSAASAARIARTLGLSRSEETLFVTSVEACHARSTTHRQAAEKRLQALIATDAYHTLTHAIFSILSDWYHFAILELVFTKDFRPSSAWIAERLGLDTATVERAISRLELAGLLVIEGDRWQVTESFPASPSGVPSAAIKKHHSQMLSKAQEALYLQRVDQRDFSTISFAMNPDDLPELAEEIKKFRRAIERKYKSRPGKRAVYTLCLQLFSLTVPESATSGGSHA